MTAPELLTKAEYATHRGVHPSRVSQLIASGQLGGAALYGNGRSARIVVAEADRQLGLALDPAQTLAQGGRPIATAAPPSAEAASPADDHQLRHLKGKADQAEIGAERARRQLCEDRGVYQRTVDAEAAWSRELSDLMQQIEHWLRDAADLAMTESANGVRAVELGLRRSFRALRQRHADGRVAASHEAPAFVEDPDLSLDDTSPPSTDEAD